VPDAPFEITVPVRLDVTVNGFSVAVVIVNIVVVVVVGGRPSLVDASELPLDSERGVHHVIGHRALRQRPVELAGERHLERVHILVVVRMMMMAVVGMVVVVVVEPERVGLGERGRWPDRLLLGRLRCAPVHVVVGRRRAHYGVQRCELVVVGRDGPVEIGTAEEHSAAQVLFVVPHRTGSFLSEIWLERRVSSSRLFRDRERRRQYVIGVES